MLHSLNEDQILSYGLFVDPPFLNSISVSRIQLFATPWTVARHASLFMEFYRQEYWSGLPCPSPGHLPDPGIEPGSSSLQADSLLSEPWGSPNSVSTNLTSTVFALIVVLEYIPCHSFLYLFSLFYFIF